MIITIDKLTNYILNFTIIRANVAASTVAFVLCELALPYIYQKISSIYCHSSSNIVKDGLMEFEPTA